MVTVEVYDLLFLLRRSRSFGFAFSELFEFVDVVEFVLKVEFAVEFFVCS